MAGYTLHGGLKVNLNTRSMSWETATPRYAGRVIWELTAIGAPAVAVLETHLRPLKASPPLSSKLVGQFMEELDASCIEMRKHTREVQRGFPLDNHANNVEIVAGLSRILDDAWANLVKDLHIVACWNPCSSRG